MTVKVLPIMEGLRWEPNATDAVLVVDDFGRAARTLRAHQDDANQ